MRKLLKYLSVFCYVIAVDYFANLLVEQKIVTKNYLFAICWLLILSIGVFSIMSIFDKFNNRRIKHD